jgi:hypothetical protein
MAGGKTPIKHVRILVIAGDGGKSKSVGIDISHADKIVELGVSDAAGTLLSVIEQLIEGQEDAGKIFITPESEKAEDKPTYLLRNKPGLQGKADRAQSKADKAQQNANDATGSAKTAAQGKANHAQERADTAQGKADEAAAE